MKKSNLIIVLIVVIIVFSDIVLMKKPRNKHRKHQGSVSIDDDQDVDEGSCNATSIFDCNVTESVGASNASSSDQAPMGIDLERLAWNISELRKLLSNDTGLDFLVITTLEQDRSAKSGSYIIPVLSRTRYDNLTAPNLFSYLPVDVNFALFIYSISGVDTTRMEYLIDVELTMQWRDVRLIHEFQPYILIKDKNISERIWRPDPYFINEKEANLVDVPVLNLKMAVFPQGQVVYVMRMILTMACPMVFCRYPHDVQQCDFRIGSIGYSMDDVTFSWVNDSAVRMNKDVKLPEYFLSDLNPGYCVNNGKIVTTSCLRVAFTLERSLSSHLLRKFIPSAVAMIFSWSSLYAPWYLEEVKIVNPVVLLLTLKQLQRTDESLPPVSYVTPLDVWFSTVQAFIVLALFEAVFYYSLMKRRDRYRSRAKECSDPEEVELMKEKGRRYKSLADSLEDKAKIVFPLLFVIFVILYATLIARGSQTSCISSSILNAISASVEEPA